MSSKSAHLSISQKKKNTVQILTCSALIFKKWALRTLFSYFFLTFFGSELQSSFLQHSPEQPKVRDLLLWRILFLWESCRSSETSRAPYCAKVLLLFCVCWSQRGKMVSVRNSSVFVYWQINRCAVRISHTSQIMQELLQCFCVGLNTSRSTFGELRPKQQGSPITHKGHFFVNM